MEVDEFEAVKVDMKKTIESLSKSGDFDEVLMKKIKNMCKKNDRNVCLAQKLLFVQLKRNHCAVRLNCVQIIDQLFQRSHSFRSLVIDDFQSFVELTLGSDPSKPLPPPLSLNNKLRRESIRKIKGWHLKFGEGYKKLRLSFNFLKQIVDFEDLSLINDEQRLMQREREEKLARLWRERVRKVGEEVAEYNEDIASWFTRTENMFLALEGSEDISSFAEEISGQHNVLTRRLLPKAKAWVVTLTKAGNSNDQELTRKVIDIKNRLSSSLAKFESLGLRFDNDDEVIVKVEEIKPERCSDDKHDPTTWQATVKKVTGQDLDLNLQLEDKSNIKRKHGDPEISVEPTPGSSGVSIPRIRLKDIQEPDRMMVDPEKSRFWVSDNREGEVLSVGSTQVVSEFAGSEEPVKWSCRAKLASGKLCPRMDRVKCPLHGIIVARDESGEVVGKPDQKINFDIAPKPKVKRKGMKSAVKWDETSRSRIEKKIFSKSSALRVARDLRKYDKIRTKDKFVDQFNY